MGLDDLLSDPDDGPVGRRAASRDRTRDRRRALLLGGTAVAVAIGLGVGVGLVAAALGGDEPRTLTSTPRSTPPVVLPSSSPSAPPSASSPTPLPTPSVDVPASGTDVGYLVAARESSEQGAALSVSFDRVQFLTGDAARSEAAKRGDEVDNDYYVVNDNTRLRTLVVADGATVSGDSSFNSWAGDDGSGQRARTLDELARFVRTDQGRETLFDLRYDAQGRVTAIAERYLP